MKENLLQAQLGEPSNYPDRPLDIDELARWLNCSRRFLEMEVERGRLRVRRISKRLIRFLPGDVADWLNRAASEVEA